MSHSKGFLKIKNNYIRVVPFHSSWILEMLKIDFVSFACKTSMPYFFGNKKNVRLLLVLFSSLRVKSLYSRLCYSSYSLFLFKFFVFSLMSSTKQNLYAPDRKSKQTRNSTAFFAMTCVPHFLNGDWNSSWYVWTSLTWSVLAGLRPLDELNVFFTKAYQSTCSLIKIRRFPCFFHFIFFGKHHATTPTWNNVKITLIKQHNNSHIIPQGNLWDIVLVPHILLQQSAYWSVMWSA